MSLSLAEASAATPAGMASTLASATIAMRNAIIITFRKSC